jgi:Na+-transporting methylmalonyl-CoA/oxaloacetate decarboxylase gamma subunit
LYGLEAIDATNGWAMAIAGALIVMAGLAILSLVISQLHKLVDFWEMRSKPPAEKTASKTKKSAENTYDPERPFLNMAEAAKHYQAACQELGDRFELRALFAVFYHSGFPHPHLTIRSLRESGHLISEGDGYFSWKV